MADDLKSRGAQDRARINLSEDHEVQHWTKALGVSKELEKAVQAVGNAAEKVREHLNSRR